MLVYCLVELYLINKILFEDLERIVTRAQAPLLEEIKGLKKQVIDRINCSVIFMELWCYKFIPFSS